MLSQWLSGKELLANVGDSGDVVSIPRLGRSPGGGHGNPLQQSCLDNSMDRGVWQATVDQVIKNHTRLSDLSTYAHKCQEVELLYLTVVIF